MRRNGGPWTHSTIVKHDNENHNGHSYRIKLTKPDAYNKDYERHQWYINNNRAIPKKQLVKGCRHIESGDDIFKKCYVMLCYSTFVVAR